MGTPSKSPTCVVLITGASRGFGRCAAMQFISLFLNSDGSHVKHSKPLSINPSHVRFILCGRSSSELQQTEVLMKKEKFTHSISFTQFIADFSVCSSKASPPQSLESPEWLQRMNSLLSEVVTSDMCQFFLFLNHGSIGPLNRFDHLTPHHVITHTNVNYVSHCLIGGTVYSHLKALPSSTTRDVRFVLTSSLLAQQKRCCQTCGVVRRKRRERLGGASARSKCSTGLLVQ
eukprot:GHVN01048894.1.p1 GENE.GHVN01048894.1~~GHVN01048894.1.p1  ORF type:complete len:231 (+),score=52.12 GHVN01048894.1:252-944(+)